MVGTIIKVITTGAGRWRVEGESHDEVLTGDLDKIEALEVARRIAKDRGGQLILIGEAGNVELSEEYDWGLATPEAARGARTVSIRTVSVVEDDATEWLVECDEPDEILGSFTTKDEAVTYARPAAAARKAHLIVHQPDGDIDWTEDYAWAEGEQ